KGAARAAKRSGYWVMGLAPRRIERVKVGLDPPPSSCQSPGAGKQLARHCTLRRGLQGPRGTARLSDELTSTNRPTGDAPPSGQAGGVRPPSRPDGCIVSRAGVRYKCSVSEKRRFFRTGAGQGQGGRRGGGDGGDRSLPLVGVEDQEQEEA